MIEYDIRLPDGRSFSCSIKKHRKPKNTAIRGTPWTDLGFGQCTDCPLKAETGPSCPLALDVQETISAFKTLPHDSNVDVIVKTKERWYFKNLPIADAFSSLFQFLTVTSGCPVLRGNKWQRHFHIPFLSKKEALFLEFAQQSVQILNKDQATASPTPLEAFIKTNNRLDKAKKQFLERCRLGAKEDSILNGVLQHIEYAFETEDDSTALIMEFCPPEKRAG